MSSQFLNLLRNASFQEAFNYLNENSETLCKDASLVVFVLQYPKLIDDQRRLLISVFIRNGLDVNTSVNGYPLFIPVVGLQSLSVIELFLEAGVNPTIEVTAECKVKGFCAGNIAVMALKEAEKNNRKEDIQKCQKIVRMLALQCAKLNIWTPFMS